MASPPVFGWYRENLLRNRNDGRWIEYYFSSFAGIIPWVAVVIYVWAPGLHVSPPGFVYGIIASLFVFFNCLAVNMVLQYEQVGPWRDYLFGEKVSIILSLTAKAQLAWQILFPALMSGTGK